MEEIRPTRGVRDLKASNVFFIDFNPFFLMEFLLHFFVL
jgi:hypothetical protein